MPFGEFLRRIDDATLYLAEVHLPTTLPDLMADIVAPEIIPPGSACAGVNFPRPSLTLRLSTT